MASDWLTVDEAAAVAQVTRKTIYRWVTKGAVRADRVQHARRLWIWRADVVPDPRDGDPFVIVSSGHKRS